MKQLWVNGAAAVLTVAAAWGDDTPVQYERRRDQDGTMAVEHDTSRPWVAYKANELDFSVFGSGTVGERTIRHPSEERIERNGKLGLGEGISYFFCRNLGIESYAYTESTHHNFIDDVSGDLVARFPILQSGVAPYALG